MSNRPPSCPALGIRERLQVGFGWPGINTESRQSKTARALCETSRLDQSARVFAEQSKKLGPPRVRFPIRRSQKSKPLEEKAVNCSLWRIRELVPFIGRRDGGWRIIAP